MKHRASYTHGMVAPWQTQRKTKQTNGRVSLSVCLIVCLCLRWSLTPCVILCERCWRATTYHDRKGAGRGNRTNYFADSTLIIDRGMMQRRGPRMTTSSAATTTTANTTATTTTTTTEILLLLLLLVLLLLVLLLLLLLLIPAISKIT